MGGLFRILACMVLGKSFRVLGVSGFMGFRV